jgi:antitoxin HigA-1
MANQEDAESRLSLQHEHCQKRHTQLESSSRRNSARGVPEAAGHIGLRVGEAPPRARAEVNDIVLERRGVSADTAVRLSRFFGTTEQFWLNLQGAYEISRVKAEHAGEIELIKPRAAASSR